MENEMERCCDLMKMEEQKKEFKKMENSWNHTITLSNKNLF